MEEQFNYIHNLAKKYKEYNNNSTLLYDTLNSLSVEQLNTIYTDYTDPNLNFGPLNLLRSEIAYQMLNGKTLDNNLVENIKQKIRDKDTSFFTNLSDKIITQFKNYNLKKKDIFSNWQRPWGIFHTFIYNTIERQTVNAYLKQISEQLIQDLQIKNFDYHYVDFYGSSNFGADFCWIALYPIEKTSHQDAYQFFLRIGEQPQAGKVGGEKIKKKYNYPNENINVSSYLEALKVLESMKEDIIQKNKFIRNYFKFAPGKQAVYWDKFKTEKTIGVDYHDLIKDDISNINTLEEINQKAGLEPKSRNLENVVFFKNANINDVVFVSKGVNTCLGIGIIEGEYFYENDKQNYDHKRKVKWITDNVYQHEPKSNNGYNKNLFRPDAFSPIKSSDFIIKQYLRLYPELETVFKEHSLIETNTLEISDNENQTDDLSQENEESSDIAYWWLNVNPSIWSLSKAKENERQTYTTRNERGNKRRVYQYFEQVKEGDILIGYESSPVKHISAFLEITKPLHQSEKEGEVIEFRIAEKLDVPVAWNELSNIKELEECEVFINNQGSLFSLKSDEFDIIRDIIDSKNILPDKEISDSKIDYSYINDPEKPFLPIQEVNQIINLLERKKNIILQGAPGVGKTFIARKIAYEMMKQRNDLNIEMVQFHQSFSYEDFIQGFKPSKDKIQLKNGVFLEFCRKALSHPEEKYFFIIDEINRGNISKIFGELMMLIESDKRKEKYKLKLTYSDDERFYIPENIYIIGLMNTADRSLAIIDYALRRRFAFYEIYPSFDKEFSESLKSAGISDNLINHITERIKKVNEHICRDSNLGKGFQIGHSYFCDFNKSRERVPVGINTNKNSDESIWYNDILNYELKPMLEEIWFDEVDKVQEMFNLLKY